MASAGGSPSASAGTSADPGGAEGDDAVKFSQCMRANGVPNFPDPKEGSNGGVDLSIPEGTDPQKVAAAQAKCREFLPGGGEVQKPDAKGLEELRKFAKCMREHGVTKFPDPSADGQQTDITKLGIDPMSDSFQAAQKACQPAGSSTGPQNGTNG